jgi:hypothetical protein
VNEGNEAKTAMQMNNFMSSIGLIFPNIAGCKD